jgi:hypothetical protein
MRFLLFLASLLASTPVYAELSAVADGAGVVKIAWDANSEASLAGYVVLLSKSSGSYT